LKQTSIFIRGQNCRELPRVRSSPAIGAAQREVHLLRQRWYTIETGGKPVSYGKLKLSDPSEHSEKTGWLYGINLGYGANTAVGYLDRFIRDDGAYHLGINQRSES
jgi:hypothetical protein